MDFYDSASVSFTGTYGNLTDRSYKVNASIDFETGLLDEEFREIKNNGDVLQDRAVTYDGKEQVNTLDADFKEKTILESNYSYSDKNDEAMDITKRIKTDANGVKSLNSRSSKLPLGMSADAMYPQQYGAQFLSDLNSWDIVGSEVYLDRESVILEGAYPQDLGQKLNFVCLTNTTNCVADGLNAIYL